MAYPLEFRKERKPFPPCLYKPRVHTIKKNVHSFSLAGKNWFYRPRARRIVRASPREARLLWQIAECLPIYQQYGIIFPGYRSFYIPCDLLLVPFDKPRRRVEAAVTFGTDAGGAGWR